MIAIELQLELHLDLVDERWMADGLLAQLGAARARLHQHPLGPREPSVVDEQLAQRALQYVHPALQVAELRHLSFATSVHVS